MPTGPVEAGLLRMLAQLSGARRVLEIGTYTGRDVDDRLRQELTVEGNAELLPGCATAAKENYLCCYEAVLPRRRPAGCWLPTTPPGPVRCLR